LVQLLIYTIDAIARLLIFLVIASAVLSFFVPPYHPLRRSIDQIVEPMLRPIRRVVPLVGMLDFSPLVLILLIQVFSVALINFLYVFVR
jgi:YggT family protein